MGRKIAYSFFSYHPTLSLRLTDCPSYRGGVFYRPNFSCSAEPIGIPQILIEDAGHDDLGVSREIQPRKLGLCTTFLRCFSHVRDCQDRGHIMGKAALGRPQLVNCTSDRANRA